MTIDYKIQAAQRALEFVHSGMCLGLGTGSTAAHFIELLALHLKSGVLRDVRARPDFERDCPPCP